MTYETLTEQEWRVVDRAWDLLDHGKIEEARAETDTLLRQRPGHPDLRVLDAAVALEEGHPRHAFQALDGAERSADPATFFHLRALTHYDLSQMADARDDAERALAVRPELAEAHALLAKVHEFLGDQETASEHQREAEDLDPESFAAPLDVGDDEFDALVEKSVSELPDEVRKHLAEIPILVQAFPPLEALTAEEPPLSPDILGLFMGRHLLERSHGDVPGSPGAIYLFRRNLLRACADKEELAREVRITVQHEVGHLLGLDEDDLEEWGLA